MNEQIIKELKSEFKNVFKKDAEAFISSGGRLEILGNHTDHNHGLCIVANCSLRMNTTIARDTKVSIKSKGYRTFTFNLDNLQVEEKEYCTSLAMAKGVIAKLKELGYNIGGFDAYIDSEIPNGSGVSSSAAFEVLIGSIISYLYNDAKIDALTIAKVSQFSERVYFNKPCGLLDQIGAAYRACNFIDFENIDNPKIETLDFNLPLSIYLINSEGNHSDLVDLYASIPNGMRKVANEYGKEYLRDINAEKFEKKFDSGEIDPDEANMKAKHFFNENRNVLLGVKALEEKSVDDFLQAVRQSQFSSATYLKNTYVSGEYEGSPQNIVDSLNTFIQHYGAVRIHGGGFKGSVICFVKNDYCDEFETQLSRLYSKDKWKKVSIASPAIEYKVF